ncbi:hypothetical protein MLD38_010786 [Melastoma candidum]|uniref:Uncharacterized protein n=1 Tax=Melastoma candidum TaxID=119954 RepID=A0ACB9R536_9MYRT|nr:hypothetical protein MLD38_010786 [Melastoma candidum]
MKILPGNPQVSPIDVDPALVIETRRMLISVKLNVGVHVCGKREDFVGCRGKGMERPGKERAPYVEAIREKMHGAGEFCVLISFGFLSLFFSTLSMWLDWIWAS